MAATRLTDSQKSELVARYSSGAASAALAAAYGCSVNTVSRVVKAALAPADYERLKQARARGGGPAAAQPPAGARTLLREPGAGPGVDPSDAAGADEEVTPAFDPAAEGEANGDGVDLARAGERSLAIDGADDFGDESSDDVGDELEDDDVDDDVDDDDVDEDALDEDALDAELDEDALDEDEIDDEFGDDLDEADHGDEDDDLDDDDLDDDELEDTDDDADPAEFAGAGADRGLTRAMAAGLDPVNCLPLAQAELPASVYLLVDKTVELEARPLSQFSELGQLPPGEEELQALQVFVNPRQAKRQCGRNQRVIKIPDARLLERTAPYLIAQGISRVVIENGLYSLPGA